MRHARRLERGPGYRTRDRRPGRRDRQRGWDAHADLSLDHVRAGDRGVHRHLYAERGFDAVTVADIAAATNVSAKTVFNYFATKEDLVLDGREETEAELVRVVRERAPDESILSAVRRPTLLVAGRLNALPAERRGA